MDNRAHRIIGILLAISLLFAGMYVDTPAEDLFAYGLAGHMTASIAPVPSDIDNDAICPTDLPVIHNIDLQAREKYQQRYRETNESLYLLYAGSGFISQGKSFIHHTSTYLFYRTQTELITEYVYRSDGKKRI